MTNIAIRWSGSLLIIGAALLGTAILLASLAPEQGQQLPPLANACLFLAGILLLLSLPAMYARQANLAGWLGLLGHVLLQTGVVFFVVASASPLLYSSFDRPFEDSVTAGLLGIALILGLLLSAIATIRVGVYPRGAGIFLLIGTASFFFSFFIAELLPGLAGQVGGVILSILLALALAWIGLSMWRDPRPAT